MDELKIKQEVLSILEIMNKCWTTENNVEKLDEYFHKNIVVFEPGRRELRVGKKECIDGWKSFVENNKINYWKESEHLVQLYNGGKSAVVTYYWEISTENNDRNFISKGRDMFVFVKEDEKWLAIADQFSPEPS